MGVDARVRQRRNGVTPVLRSRERGRGKGDREHRREAGDPGGELPVISVDVELFVSARLWIETDFQHALLLETDINGAQPLEAASEKACTEQQYQRQRHLRDDERFAERASAAARAARVLLQHGSGVFTGATPCGCETEEKSAEDRHGDGQRKHANVGGQIERDRKLISPSHQEQQKTASPKGKGQPKHRACKRQREAFGEYL